MSGNSNSGRRPEPTALRLYRGNPSKRPVGEEPHARIGRPECPEWLSEEAKRHWDLLIPELEIMGVLTVVDGGALAGMCQAWARYREATEFLNQRGGVYKTKSDYLVQAPQVAIAQQSLELYVRIATEFGLTASSRARLATPKPRKTESLLTG